MLGHIGARGSAYWNVRLLDQLFDFEEIRVHSRRPESREAFGATLGADLGKAVTVTDELAGVLEGADILVEASRLEAPEPLVQDRLGQSRARWSSPMVPTAASRMTSPTMCDKIVVDHWEQCLVGPFGCLRRHVDSGKVTRESIHGELGSVCAGTAPRSRVELRRPSCSGIAGLSISDIALGYAMLDKADRLGVGHTLPYA